MIRRRRRADAIYRIRVLGYAGGLAHQYVRRIRNQFIFIVIIDDGVLFVIVETPYARKKYGKS